MRAFRLFSTSFRGLCWGVTLAALTAATVWAAPGYPAAEKEVLSPAEQGVISQALGRDDPRYHAVPSAAGPRAANARHEIQTEFSQQGVAIVSGPDRITFALKQAGYGEALSPVSSAAPHAQANRVEYRRGNLVEWYANGPSGLEQGFTLASAPERLGTGPLTLALDLSGNLTASLDPDGRALAFSRAGGGGPVLRYAGLIAYDAAGRKLPAHLELSDRTLLVRVDDAGAQYPVVVDPFVHKATLYPSDLDEVAFGSFGMAVAISGDTIVIGAPNSHDLPGLAYVFVRPPSGWSGDLIESAKLTPSIRELGDTFGASVAIHGDTVIVGALHFHNTSANPHPSDAYVFVKPAGGWAGALNENAKLTASDGSPDDQFGWPVAVNGKTVVIGAPRDEQTEGVPFEGAAYVFVKPAGGWAGALTENAKLRGGFGRGSGNPLFGTSIAVRGDTVVVGAPWQDVNGNVNEGAAYVFVEPAGGWAGTPTHRAKLLSPAGSRGDHMGTSLAISKDTIFVGALGEEFVFQPGRGAVYVFVKPAGGWTGRPLPAARLQASDGQGGDNFGREAAASGDRVLIGTLMSEPSSYLFAKPAGGWAGALTEIEKVLLPGQDPPGLGVSFNTLGLSGNTMVARGDNSGMVFVREYVVEYLNLRELSRIFPPGSTIPVKVQLSGEDGIPISNREAESLAASCSVQVSFSGDGSTGCAGYARRAFHFDIKTSRRLAPGIYTITVSVLLDGETVSAETVDVRIR